MARCAAADEGRKRRRRLAMFERFSHWQEMRRAGDGGAPLDVARLKHSLGEMAPDNRTLMKSKYLEQQSYAELAAAFGLSAKAVESRLGRLRAKLRRALEAEGGRDG